MKKEKVLCSKFKLMKIEKWRTRMNSNEIIRFFSHVGKMDVNAHTPMKKKREKK